MTTAPSQTVLPSVANWTQHLPGSPDFRFTNDSGTRWMLSNPAKWSKALIDTCRLRPGAYRLKWLNELNPMVAASFVDAVLSIAGMGKDVMIYTGGHHDDDFSWLQAAVYAGSLGKELDEQLKFFRPLRGHSRVSLCLDASAGDATDLAQELRAMVSAELLHLGWNVVLEAYPREGRSISRLPSVATAALVRRRPWPASFDPRKHGVLVTNSEGRDLMPTWKAEGRDIYVDVHAVAEEKHLSWWEAAPIIPNPT